MKISVLCTDPGHRVVPYLLQWCRRMADAGHAATLVHDKKELPGGDVLFLVSCSQYIPASDRRRYAAALVLHASDLPKGRGWSPHVWAIVGGASQITVCLLEADEPIDSGRIWLRERFSLEGHELLPEINEKLFTVELDLMTRAVHQWGRIVPQPQQGDAGTPLPKRTPEHSRLDPNKTLADQFDLLRVVDSDRYPAFFDYRGKRFILKVEKAPGERTQ